MWKYRECGDERSCRVEIATFTSHTVNSLTDSSITFDVLKALTVTQLIWLLFFSGPSWPIRPRRWPPLWPDAATVWLSYYHPQPCQGNTLTLIHTHTHTHTQAHAHRRTRLFASSFQLWHMLCTYDYFLNSCNNKNTCFYYCIQEITVTTIKTAERYTEKELNGIKKIFDNLIKSRSLFDLIAHVDLLQLHKSALIFKSLH